MSTTSPDARAVVRAAEAMTTQLRRIADALTAPRVVDLNGLRTTPDDGVRVPCPDCSGAPLFRPDEITDHIVSQHTGEQRAPAADENAQGATDEEQTLRLLRRESLLVLLTRLQRGRNLSQAEADTLRQHVETEIREADTARAVARSNLRHVQLLVPELEQAQAAIERVRAVVTRAAQTTAAGISDHDIGRYDMAVAVLAALDGTEQPTTTEA
jgi:hypothetical protein